jgi:hypothetical protein
MSNNLDFNVFVVVVLLKDCRQLRKESRGTILLFFFFFLFFPRSDSSRFFREDEYYCLAFIHIIRVYGFPSLYLSTFFGDALSRPDNLQTSSSLHSSNARVVELSKNIEMADEEKRKSLV